MTMKDRILEYIIENGSITTFDAFTKLYCTRLSEYIRLLRLEYTILDEEIKAVNVYGEKVHYKKYYLGDKICK